MVGLRPRSLALVLACALAAPVSAATRAYFVEPKTATSAWCPYGGYVGQTFVANVDSIAYIEWFVGELSAEGAYRFEIRDHVTDELICRGDEPVPAKGWQGISGDIGDANRFD